MNEASHAGPVKGAAPLRRPKAEAERPKAPEPEKGQPRQRKGQAIGHRCPLHPQGGHAKVAENKNVKPGEADEVRPHPNPHGGPGVPGSTKGRTHDEIHGEGYVKG